MAETGMTQFEDSCFVPGILNSFFFVCYCVLCVLNLSVFGSRFVLLYFCDDI